MIDAVKGVVVRNGFLGRGMSALEARRRGTMWWKPKDESTSIC